MARYWLTDGFAHWIVELRGDQSWAHKIVRTDQIPDHWATCELEASLGRGSRPDYLDNPGYTIRPLPLTDPPLLSPLDFFAPRKE